MKSFQCAAVFLFVGVIGWISASPAPPASGGYSASSGSSVAGSGSSAGGSGSLVSGVQEIEAEAPLAGAQAAVYDLTRQRKSVSPYGGSGASYGGGASIPAPPCPKNYLFSCQPNLSPVACAAPAAGGYGSVGAYSAPVPTYAAPLNGGYGGLQHQYGSGAYIAPQGYGYGHQNHLYQF